MVDSDLKIFEKSILKIWGSYLYSSMGSICVFIIYYTILINKYYNQVDMENKTIEENRNIESSESITNWNQ